MNMNQYDCTTKCKGGAGWINWLRGIVFRKITAGDMYESLLGVHRMDFKVLCKYTGGVGFKILSPEYVRYGGT